MRSRFLTTTLATGLAVIALIGGARQVHGAAAASLPNDDKTIVHVLNRIGFGARPADVERVQRMGLERYIDEQLHPERLSDAATLAEVTAVSYDPKEDRAVIRVRGSLFSVTTREASGSTEPAPGITE